LKPPPSVLHSVAVKYLQYKHDFEYALAKRAGLVVEAAHRLAATCSVDCALFPLHIGANELHVAVQGSTSRQATLATHIGTSTVFLGASDAPAACICTRRLKEALPTVLLLLFAHVLRLHSLPTKLLCYPVTVNQRWLVQQGLGRSRRTCHACALFARDVPLKQVVVRVPMGFMKQPSTDAIAPHTQ